MTVTFNNTDLNNNFQNYQYQYMVDSIVGSFNGTDTKKEIEDIIALNTFFRGEISNYLNNTKCSKSKDIDDSDASDTQLYQSKAMKVMFYEQYIFFFFKIVIFVLLFVFVFKYVIDGNEVKRELPIKFPTYLSMHY